jgi:hypothetical protein
MKHCSANAIVISSVILVILSAVINSVILCYPQRRLILCRVISQGSLFLISCLPDEAKLSILLTVTAC